MRLHATGASLVEVCIVIGLLAILGSLGVSMVSDLVTTSKQEKLSSDVATVNRSVATFLGTGGDLDEAVDAETVLAVLKKKMTSGSRNPSRAGAKLDSRVMIEFQTEPEAASEVPRAYWDSSKKRFVIASSGSTPGIKRFYLDDRAGETDPGERQASFAFQYASEDPWIWDYTEAEAATLRGPSVIPVNSVVSAPSPPSTALPSSALKSSVVLSPPYFSIPGGTYPISRFGLQLTLQNPNPEGESSIYYRTDYGEWIPYTGAIQITPETTVSAMAVGINSDFDDSSIVEQFYDVSPLRLQKPIISPSRNRFGLFSNRRVRVEITNPNSPEVSRLQYRMGGDPWQYYEESFTLDRRDFPSGTLIQARVTPNDATYYSESGIALRTIGLESASIAGDAEASFFGAVGNNTMVANSQGDYFEWGRDEFTEAELATFPNPADIPELSSSWMRFSAQSFDSINTGEQFGIGTLSYFNGTVVNLTGAEQVSFAVDLSFTVGGYDAETSFSFDFSLLNTENALNPMDPWADADFVKLQNPIARETLSFNGIEFQLQLEFGETTPDGLSSFDEFHVLEGKTASTQLYGTLIEVDSVDFNR